MTICSSCGISLVGEPPLCAHHHFAYDSEWAAENKAACDFIHRGKHIYPKPMEWYQERANRITDVLKDEIRIAVSLNCLML